MPTVRALISGIQRNTSLDKVEKKKGKKLYNAVLSYEHKNGCTHQASCELIVYNWS